MPETRLEYGAYLAREGIFDLATAELKAARELDPENPRIAREEGVTYLLAGRADLGVEALERAVALDAEDSELRLLFGLALVTVNRLEDAAEELVRQGLEKDPADPATLRLAELASEFLPAGTRRREFSLPPDEMATLQAALSDTAIAEQVRSGRLTKAVTYAGFGEVPRPRLRLVTDADAEPAAEQA